MPNWVYNGLTIEGKPDAIDSLVKQMNMPFVDSIEAVGDLSYGIKQKKYINPIFSFRNIIAPTDLEAYKNQPARAEVGIDDPNWWAETMKVSETDNSWYNWNIRNWGVKWDVAVAEDDKYTNTYMEGPVENGENKVVYYNFETAWGVPMQALTNLSQQYPNLLFTLSYEEETGWGGELEILRGEVISHGEYENKCRDCDATNTLDYCEDCENEVCSACGFGNEENNNCETHKEKADA